MITKENAKNIGSKFLGDFIISNAFKITEEPATNWDIYFLPENCYYINISNIIYQSSVTALCSSLIIAIDKTDGTIRYFGSAHDEG